MKIHITKDGQQYGPFTLAQVNTALAGGELSPDDLAWHEGAPSWIMLGAVHGVVAPALRPPMPPPPPAPVASRRNTEPRTPARKPVYVAESVDYAAVEEIVAKYEGQIQASTIWFKPNIPSDILEKVLAKIDWTLISPDSVLLLVDDSEKTGFFLTRCDNYLVLTEDKIICFGTTTPGDSGTIGFTNFQNAELEHDGGGSFLIYFDGEPLIGLHTVGPQVGSEICNLLNEIAKQLAPKSVKCDGELEDCYRVLDLECTASLHEVKQAWRELSRLYEPDSRLQHDPKVQLRSKEKLKKINAAYGTLIRSLAA
jgi:hypothetical protein